MVQATRHVFAASLFVTVAALALVFCEAAPMGLLSPTGIPVGGIEVNPGVLTCGSEDAGCDTNDGGAIGCCSGPGASGGGVCVGEGGTCPVRTGLVTCNEAADCSSVAPNGSPLPCCATFHADGGYMSAGCSTGSTSTATCPAPALQLCRTHSECLGGECVIQMCPDGQIYEMCGLSSSPSFLCKYYLPGTGG